MEKLPSMAISAQKSESAKPKRKRGRPPKQRGGLSEVESFWRDDHHGERLDALKRLERLREKVDGIRSGAGKDYESAQLNRQSADVLGGSPHRGHDADAGLALAEVEVALGFDAWQTVEDCLFKQKTLETIGRELLFGQGARERCQHEALGRLGLAADQLIRFFRSRRRGQRKDLHPDGNSLPDKNRP